MLRLYVNECLWRLGRCFKHFMRIFIPHFSALALTPNIRPHVKHFVLKALDQEDSVSVLDGFVSRPVRFLWMPHDSNMDIPAGTAIHTFLTNEKCEAVSQLSPGKAIVALTHRQDWQEGLVA